MMLYKQSRHFIHKEVVQNQENKERLEMAENGQYDLEYEVHEVRLAKEIGQAKAAKELEIPTHTI